MRRESRPAGRPSPNAPTKRTRHDLEVLDRLAAIRLIADEYLQGHWVPTKTGISNIAGIVVWASRHQWASDLEREPAA